MTRRRQLPLLVFTAVSLLLLSAPTAFAENFDIESIPNQTLSFGKTLPPSAYTSGVEKSFLATWSISACSTINADIQIQFFYDVLNATRIHITKAKVKYYLGPSTRTLVGADMYANGQYGNVQIGTSTGDSHTYYTYNSATQDQDGYSYVGTYTHVGPVNVYAYHDDFGAEAYFYKDGVTIYNSTCQLGWEVLELRLRW